jgi:hypothetical protein
MKVKRKCPRGIPRPRWENKKKKLQNADMK